MIEFTPYARVILVIFGVLMMIGTITTPGVQWFATALSAYLIGRGIFGSMPNITKGYDE